MREPHSKFVLSKIAGRHFTPKDRRYIEDLLTIENYVLQPPSGQWAGMGRETLRNQHPAEFAAIFEELRPADFRKEQRERAAHARELERAGERERRAQLRRDASDRALWSRLGGLP